MLRNPAANRVRMVLDVEITGIEYRYGFLPECIEIIVEMMTYSDKGRLIRPVAYFYETYGAQITTGKVKGFRKKFQCGHQYRLTANDFFIDDGRFMMINPEVKLLDELDGIQLGKQLRRLERQEMYSSTRVFPKRLIPEAFIPILRIMIGLSCGVMLEETHFQFVQEYILADSRQWYSARFEEQNADTSELFEQALKTLPIMGASPGRLTELLVHIAAPVNADLICLVGMNERIRAAVGEETRIFVSTSISQKTTCVVGLLGR